MVYLTTERVSDAFTLCAVFVDDDGNLIDPIFDLSKTSNIFGLEIEIPDEARYLYMSYRKGSESFVSIHPNRDTIGYIQTITNNSLPLISKLERKYVSQHSTSNKCIFINVYNSTAYVYDVEHIQEKSINISTYVPSKENNNPYFFVDKEMNCLDKMTPVYGDGTIVPIGAKYLLVNCKSHFLPNVEVNALLNSTGIADPYPNLYHKKIVCFGDSITWYDGNKYYTGKEKGSYCKGYEYYLRSVAGMTVVNKGVSGADIVYLVNNFLLSYDFTDCDYVTLTSGANDTRHGVPVGTLAPIGSAFDNTFIGRFQAAIEHIFNDNPEAKICLITPIRGWIYAPDGFDDGQEHIIDGEVDEKYAIAIRDIAQLYGIPVCDWYNLVPVNLLTRKWFMNDYEPDDIEYPNTYYSLHPSTKGYKRMAEVLLPVLNGF